MTFDDYRIPDIPAESGVSALPDRPMISAAELKARFDFLASACIDAHNGLIEYLKSPDLTSGFYTYDADGKAVLLGVLLSQLMDSLQSFSERGGAAKIGTRQKGMFVQDYLDFVRDIQTQVGASYLGAENADGERTTIQNYLDALRQGQIDIVAGQVPDGFVTYAKLDSELQAFYDSLSSPSFAMNALQKVYLEYTTAHQYSNHTTVKSTTGDDIVIDYDSTEVIYDDFLDPVNPSISGDSSLVLSGDWVSIVKSGKYRIALDYFVEHTSSPGYCFALACRTKDETTAVLSDWTLCSKQIGVMALPENIANDPEAPSFVSHVTTGSILLTVPASSSMVVYPAFFYEEGAAVSLNRAVMTLERICD